MDKEKRLEGLKILVVEDDPVLLDLISEELLYFGATVDTASDGTLAFEKLETRPYDIVLSDVRMPNGDGVDLLRKSKNAILPFPSFILLTGYSNVETEEILNLGAKAVLSKPLDWNDLIDMLVATKEKISK